MLTYISDMGGGYELLVRVIGALSGLMTVSLVQAAFVKAAYRIQETTTGEEHENVTHIGSVDNSATNECAISMD